MATEKTPEEKAQDRVNMEIEAMRLRTLPNYRKAAQAAAIDVGAIRHSAAMQDYASGQATERALAAFTVKLAVADLAKSKGRKPNGEILDAPKVPTMDGPVPTTVKAPEAKSVAVKA